MNIFRVFLESGLAAQIIMVILIFFSVWSWAIFFKKFYELRGARRRGKTFLAAYNLYRTTKDYGKLTHLLEDNPHGRVLKKGIEEFNIVKSSNQSANPQFSEMVDNIRLVMEQTRLTEIEYLEGSLPTMSTIITASPFLGLLGTVWGIMESFLAVRARGSAHITVVAPGISDALITTVYGLLVALPALFFHNYLRTQANRIDDSMDKFINDAFVKFRRGLFET